jgi:hypothetical protein
MLLVARFFFFFHSNLHIDVTKPRFFLLIGMLDFYPLVFFPLNLSTPNTVFIEVARIFPLLYLHDGGKINYRTLIGFGVQKRSTLPPWVFSVQCGSHFLPARSVPHLFEVLPLLASVLERLMQRCRTALLFSTPAA